MALTYNAHVLNTYHTASKVKAGDVLSSEVEVDDNPSEVLGGSTPSSIPDVSAYADRTTSAPVAVDVVEPNLTITKMVTDSNGTSPIVALGDNLTYTLAVKNTGADTAYGVPVYDTPGAGIIVGAYGSGSSDLQQDWAPGGGSGWEIPSIGAGQTVNLTYAATLVDSSQLHNNQTIANNANVGTYYGASHTERAANSSWTYRTYTGPSTSATITVELPELTVSNTTGASGFPKSSDAQVGQPFSWRPTVINDTISTAYNATLTYQLPANWSYVPGSAGGYGDPSITTTGATQTLTWNVGTLNPGAIDPVAFEATPSVAAETTPGSGPAHLNSTTENTAWSDADSNTASADGDYTAGPDTANAQLNIPALTVTTGPKGGSWTAGAANQDWTIKVANTGAAPATNVTVSDDIPAGDAYAQGTATASPSTGFSETSYDNSGPTTNVTWTIASLAAGASTTITVPTTPAAGTPNGTVLNNTAAAQAIEVPTPASDSGSATVTDSADVAVADTAAPSPATAGTADAYTLTVTNNGPSDASNVTLSDPLDSSETFIDFAAGGGTCTNSGQNVSCSWASIPAGGSEQAKVDVALKSDAPVGPNSVQNTATVAADDDSNPADDFASAPLTVNASTDLALSATAVPANLLQGSDFTYALTATNNGPSDAAATVVQAVLPTGVTFLSADSPQCSYDTPSRTVTCPPGTLANGDSASYDVRVSADQPGAQTASATVSSASADGTPGNNTAQATADVGPAADLSVTNTGPANVAAGAQATYTLTATNNGPSDATGATVTDALPAGETFVSATPEQGSCTNSGQTATCTLGDLANGASATVTVVATADYAAAEQTLTNTAAVAADQGDPDPSNNTASATTTVGPAADMAVAETVDNPSPNQQRQATLTLTYTNHGPSTAHHVTVTDTLPAGVRFDSVDDPNCAASGQTITCSEQTMASGASATIHIQLTANDVGVQHNSAAVTADEPDPDPSNNTASGDITVGPTANLTLTKTASEPSVAADGTVAYTLTAANHGPSAAHNVTVTDPLPAGLQPLDTSIDNGGSCQTAGQTVTCTVAELDNGASATETLHARPGFALAGTTVINSGTASAEEDDTGQLSERTGTAAVTVGPAADVSVSTTAPASTPAASNLTYALQVGNSGPQDATGATVTDTLPARVTLISAQPSAGSCSASGQTVTCQLGTVPAGAGAQVLLTVSVPLADQGITLTNAAAVSADEPDPNPANNQSQAASTVVAPLITPGHLAVTVNADTPQVAFGNKVSYTIAVTNDSAAAATHVKQLITLTSPAQVISVSTPAGNCKRLTCSLGTVKPGQTVYIHLVVLPQRPGAVPVSTVANSDQGASRPARAKALTTVKTRTRLAVSKRAQHPTVQAGDTMTYALTVRNTGRHAAANVVVCDRSNLNMTYERTRGARFRQGEPCWTDPMLPAGHRFQVTLTVRFVDDASGAQTSGARATAKNAPPARAKTTVRVVGEDSVNGLEGVTG